MFWVLNITQYGEVGYLKKKNYKIRNSKLDTTVYIYFERETHNS